MQNGCAHVHKRQHADKVGSWVVDGEGVEIIDRSEDDGNVMEEDEVASNSKAQTLVELERSVLSQVAELESNEERCEGGLVGRDVILGPVDGQKQVRAGNGHNCRMNRGDNLVAQMVVFLFIGFGRQDILDHLEPAKNEKQQWIEGNGADQ